MSEARNRANWNWSKKHLDRLYITVPKGDKEKIKAAAEQAGLSLNEYIKRAIAAQMEKD